MLHRLILFLLFFCFWSVPMERLLAQDDFLGDMQVVALDQKVYLEWTIRAGNTCDGVRVYRSSDAELFQEIGRIEGVCGSPFSNITYEFYDEEPLENQQSFYRIELGNLGISQVLAVFFVDFSQQQTYLKSNPVREISTIHFKNPLQMEHQMSVFDLDGKLVFQESTRESAFKIHASDLQTGTYLLRVSDVSKGRIIGTNKLIVLR